MGAALVGRIEGLTEDAAAIEAELSAAMPIVMNIMLAQTESELRDSIKKNVYDAFHPKRYDRRGDDYGISDFDESHGIVSRHFDSKGFALGYYPQGWSVQSDPNWILDGDELIERIEKASPAYDWEGKTPGPRPFLSPLMADLIEGCKYEKWFVDDMNATNPKLGIVAGGGVERDADDWR